VTDGVKLIDWMSVVISPVWFICWWIN